MPPCPSHLRTCTSSTCRSAVRAAPQLSRGTLQHRLTRFASRLARTSPHCKVRRQVQQKDSEYPALKLSSRAGVRKSTHVRLCNSGCSRCRCRVQSLRDIPADRKLHTVWAFVGIPSRLAQVLLIATVMSARACSQEPANGS